MSQELAHSKTMPLEFGEFVKYLPRAHRWVKGLSRGTRVNVWKGKVWDHCFE